MIDGAGGAVRSIVQWYSTWFETFPAASTASTWRVWLPAARPGKLAGFEHGVKLAAGSSLQMNVTPASVSLKVKTRGRLVGPGSAGRRSSAPAAASVSTVHVYEVARADVADRVLACTEKVCEPAAEAAVALRARAGRVRGAVELALERDPATRCR